MASVPTTGKEVIYVNLNDLAIKITKREGKKVEVNIAQVKEVLACLGFVLSTLSTTEALALLANLSDQ